MRRMDRIEAGGVTGRTVATAEALANGAADQDAVRVVTAATTAMRIDAGQDCVGQQGVIMTGRTAGAARAGSGRGHQAAVIRGIGSVQPFPGRITSYNVCYTKLLRHHHQQTH